MTLEQLTELLRDQERSTNKVRLGELLMQKGYATSAQLERLIQIQKDYVAKRASAEGAVAAPAAAPKSDAPIATPAPAAQKSPTVAAATPTSTAAPAKRPAAAAPAGAKASVDLSSTTALLRSVVQAGGSDLHLHSGAPLRMRVHGDLLEMTTTPMEASACAKLIDELLDDGQRQRLKEVGQVDFAYSLPGVGRFRGNAYRQQRGTDVTLRSVPAVPPTLEGLGLPSTLAKLTNYHQGMVLLTGPAGSGKSATMAALINLVNEERADHVLTVEDPIECVHPPKRCSINHRQVGPHTGSFARALRAALREDPDVIAIGELRDLETISLAMSAAETGHLVLATLHTNSAIQTVNRLIGAFPPEQQPQIRAMLSESLRAVVSQRLVKRTDGQGRVPALEILMVNRAVSNLIRENKTFQLRSSMQTGTAQGMCLLDNSLFELVQKNVITKEEAAKQAEDKARFR